MDSALSILVTATIFSLMFAIGINRGWDDLTSIWKQPGRLLQSLFAVIVVVPVIAVALIFTLGLSGPTATGIALLASCPGAPLTTFRSQMAGADTRYVSSLQLALALLAIVVTPVTLLFFDLIFSNVADRIRVFDIIGQIAIVTFLPVVIGLCIQTLLPSIAARIRRPVTYLSNTLFVVLVVVVVVAIAMSAELRELFAVGWKAALALFLMILLSLLAGHLLGGSTPDQRSGLATAAIARNIGLAVYIAGLGQQSIYSLPTIATYLIIGVIVGIPYARYNKRLTQSNQGRA